DLTEGRSTGIPTMQKKLAENGSPMATFETDNERTFFITEIPIHSEFNLDERDDSNQDVPQDVLQDVLQDVPQDNLDIQSHILSMIKKNNQITRQEMADTAGVNIKTIGREIRKMTATIKYIGSGYSGYWEIIDK
ncbi:MAG: AAA family ATPase, partial [Rikenellaceae bacterium]